jgi:hypothetical protein
MYLLVYSPQCISISHFEFSEILIFVVEALVKIRYIFYSIFALFDLLNQSFHFDLCIILYFS